MENAPSSVLKLVSTIQKMGKKMMKATSQEQIARTVWATRRRFFKSGMGCSGLGEGFADQADQEDSDQVGEHHGDKTARAGRAHVELEQGLGEDEEGQVGGGVARASARGGEDF